MKQLNKEHDRRNIYLSWRYML